MTRPRHVLVLGGTSWLGGAVASHALARGDRVVCLARGSSGRVPGGAEHVVADRRFPGAYDDVATTDWDLVVDVSWQPDQVRSALAALAHRAARWVYVSSVSVYADHRIEEADETAGTLPAWGGVGEAPGESYGEAKVACEAVCRSFVPADRLLLARAGLIVGYGDRSDRFGYWPARFASARAGEPVLTPPDDLPVQVVDVDDLAAWLVSPPTAGVAGTVDAVGEPLTFADLVRACTTVTGVQPAPVPASDAWLTSAGVAAWAGPESLPLWLPRQTHGGMSRRSGAAARASGLRPRPLEETVEHTLCWERELGLDRARAAGLSARRERELLDSWALRGESI